MKKLLSIILSVAMLLPCVTSLAENDEIKVMLDGSQLSFDVQPIIENDRTLVPLRAIFEALGAEVEWWDEIKTVYASKELGNNINQTLTLKIGDDKMLLQKTKIGGDAGEVLDERAVTLDAPARIVSGRTLVPLRAVSEAFDCNVEWDGDTKSVTINSAVSGAATAAPTKVPAATPTPKPNHSSGGSSSGGSHSSQRTPSPDSAANTAEPVPTKAPTNRAVSFEQGLLERMTDDKNYMISPFSVKMVLAMAANGADGDTKKEMLDAMGINDINEFNEYVQSFMEYIKNAAQKNEDKERYKLPVFEVANSIWINRDYGNGVPDDISFSDDFSKIIADYYDGESGVVGNDDKVSVINGWVSEKTHEKIPTLIDDDTDFLAALINAIYMKAQWQSQFSKGATWEDTFTDRNGKKSQIDFMHDTGYYNYYGDDEIRLIEIPYYGGLSMYVAMGDASKFFDVRTDMESEYVSLSFPKFKTETSLQFNDILKDMNIKSAFSPTDAQFPNMLNPTPEFLWLDYVIQKTYINVDENGTEAAAVTMGGMTGAGSAMPPEPIEFKANKPFTYFITDDETGQIFFMGEYAFAE